MNSKLNILYRQKQSRIEQLAYQKQHDQILKLQIQIQLDPYLALFTEHNKPYSKPNHGNRQLNATHIRLHKPVQTVKLHKNTETTLKHTRIKQLAYRKPQ